MDEFDTFADSLRSAREAGGLLVAKQSLAAAVNLQKDDDVFESIRKLLKPLGLLPMTWREVSQLQALQILHRILSTDLAYGQPQISGSAADAFIAQFMSHFNAPCRFFTNGNWHNAPNSGQSWFPLTGATFDTGVIVVCASAAGILWASDED